MGYEDAAEGAFRENAEAAAATANITTADATDLDTAMALANATKAKVNDLLTKMRTAGLLTP